jgi:NitT/TauT family transport system ATP-binding protein
MTAKISLQHVGMIFSRRRAGEADRVTALDDIHLDIETGEFIVLVGPSGCGKSTLLDLVAGLATPSAGAILVDGRAIDGPGHERGIVFQQYALLPWRTALGNVALGLEGTQLPRRARRDRALHYLDLVGLSSFADSYPHELSGGMKQRVAIARSLSHDPDVLLMDEPFAALDAQTREMLQSELLRIWERTGKTIVFVTHSIDEAVFLGQRVAVMSARPGRIVEVIDIPLGPRTADQDLRSDPAFNALRHRIWSLIRTNRSPVSDVERAA